MRSPVSRIIAYCLLFCLAGKGLSQDLPPGSTTEPGRAVFITTDVENFIRAFGMLGPGTDTAMVLQAEYLDRGTPGLKMFIEKYSLTPRMMMDAMRLHPDKYSTLSRLDTHLTRLAARAREAFVKYGEVVPGAVFLPTYFLVESYRGIGSGSVEGQLISVEKWEPPVDHEITMIAHEVTHIQQVVAVGYEKYVGLFGPEKNLLGLCLREGTAEFIAELVTGEITQEEAREYTERNEKRLWESFREAMSGAETGDWMWKKPENPQQPMHVGYVMGCRIVRAYYENAADKAAAIREILSVTDYPAFLAKSGYAEKLGE